MPTARSTAPSTVRPARRRRAEPAPVEWRDAPDLDPIHDPGPDGARARLQALPGLDEAATEPLTVGAGHSIRVGTASWTDPTMTAAGVFYPRDAGTAEERLQYYASRFPVVEVDATYYALPTRRLSELWVERTPPDFTFDIKAHALMTGQPTETRRLPRDIRDALPVELATKPRIYAKDLPDEVEDEVWAAFADGIDPLRESGQLGAVFLQYPRWFFTGSEQRDEIRQANERLRRHGLQAAVELRNATWFNEKNVERTLRFLEEEGLPLVMVDGPQGFKSSVPPIVATTHPDLAIVRFHGRRTATWERMARDLPTVERFRYLYEPGELEEWVPRIVEAARQSKDTHVLMNNCYANYGSTNARELAAMLAEELDAWKPDPGTSSPTGEVSPPSTPPAAPRRPSASVR